METIKLNYQEVENICKKIYNQAKKDNFYPDIILGVSVGGLFPAIHLARLFNTKNLISISVCSYEKNKRGKLKILNFPLKSALKEKKILVVDDILDSGNTFQFIKDLLSKKYDVKKIKLATLTVNTKNCAFYPDYYVKKHVKWIEFPWDRFEKI